MEFFQHYITADIKYNFWCDEDGHQFREDWVKCRINIKYFDSPTIQISCYPVNHFETIPLSVDIDSSKFRFERSVEVSGKNVLAVLWTQHNGTSEFSIAIDDRAQFQNYETYLNNMMKLCRIVEIERLSDQANESSLRAGKSSLFSVSQYLIKSDEIITSQLKKGGAKKRGLKFVKNATKYLAKGLNQMLVHTKSTLIKTSNNFTRQLSPDHESSTYARYEGDITISSVGTEITCMDMTIANGIERFSSQSTLQADDQDYPCVAESIFQTPLEIPLKIALSTPNMAKSWFGNDKTLSKAKKNIFRKGTPYKLNIRRLTMDAEESLPLTPNEETNEDYIAVDVSNLAHQTDGFDDMAKLKLVTRFNFSPAKPTKRMDRQFTFKPNFICMI